MNQRQRRRASSLASALNVDLISVPTAYEDRKPPSTTELVELSTVLHLVQQFLDWRTHVWGQDANPSRRACLSHHSAISHLPRAALLLRPLASHLAEGHHRQPSLVSVHRSYDAWLTKHTQIDVHAATRTRSQEWKDTYIPFVLNRLRDTQG